MGGEDNPFANMNIIDYVEFATLGNALDFGDITVARRDPACLSSPTRGLVVRVGLEVPGRVTTIDNMLQSQQKEMLLNLVIYRKQKIWEIMDAQILLGVYAGGQEDKLHIRLI